MIISQREKKKTFECFSEGVMDGLNTVLKLFPILLALFLSVNLFRVSGMLELLSNFLIKIFSVFCFPNELTNLIVIRPISGSASLAVATDIINQYGVDSVIGLTAATIMGATETTLYALAVYTGEIKKKIPLKLIILTIFGNFLGIVLSNIICKLYFN